MFDYIDYKALYDIQLQVSVDFLMVVQFIFNVFYIVYGHFNKRDSSNSNRYEILTIYVHLVDHMFKFLFCRILSQVSHHCSQFMSGYHTIIITIK